jgi:hypothetical protein
MITACHQLMPLCASCHIQANAFGDVALLVTELMAQQLGTMRLINSRFARETNSFGMKEQTH